MKQNTQTTKHHTTPNTTQNTTTIIWASQHHPLPAQKQALHRLLGASMIVQLAGRIPSAEYVVEKALRWHARYIVAVLPLSMIHRICELARKHGITVLYSEMESVKLLRHKPVAYSDYDPAREVPVRAHRAWRIMRFKKFHVIKGVQLILEPLEATRK